MKILELRNVKRLATAAIASAVLLTSCNRNDEDSEAVVTKPTITKTEVGIRNSRIGYAGADLHLAAEIEAAGKISTVEVEIHKENGTGWKKKEIFNEFGGQLNTHFHKHIDIPASAELGEYHVHIVVKDHTGLETIFEEDIEIKKNTDSEAPKITIEQSPTSNQPFNLGESIRIKGTVGDNVNVGGYLAALVRSDDTQVSNTSVIIMDLQYFQDKQQVAFDAKINVGAAFDNQSTPVKIQGENAWRTGDYYILVRAWDNTGNITDTQKYPVKINL